jgi:uncharacterized pyridoxamine 5'-phosphate oxidase family protein
MKKNLRVQDVISNFTFLNRIFLATVEKDQPRVRPITMIYLAGRLLITTSSKATKVEQIKQNNKIEFLFLIPDDEGNTGYIRGKCVAKFNNETKIKQELYEKVPHVSKLWKSADDSDLIVFELVPVGYDYMKPGNFHSTLIPI